MDDGTPTRAVGEPSDDNDVWPLETRRIVTSLAAEGQFDDLRELVRETMPQEDPMEIALSCLASELRATSMRLDETHMALQVLGAMVNGLFGAQMAEDADDLLHDLHGAGLRLRRYIGLEPLA